MPDTPRIYASLAAPGNAPPVVGRGRSFAEATINALLNHFARFGSWPSRDTILATLAEVPGGPEGGQQAMGASWADAGGRHGAAARIGSNPARRSNRWAHDGEGRSRTIRSGRPE